MWSGHFIFLSFKYNFDTEYPLAGLNKSLQQDFKINVFENKGQNE